jgi:hypothetical protein
VRESYAERCAAADTTMLAGLVEIAGRAVNVNIAEQARQRVTLKKRTLIADCLRGRKYQTAGLW